MAVEYGRNGKIVTLTEGNPERRALTAYRRILREIVHRSQTEAYTFTIDDAVDLARGVLLAFAEVE